MDNYMLEIGKKAKEASKILAGIDTRTKNKALMSVVDALLENSELIKEENEKDLKAAREKGISESFIDRLTLTDERIKSMANGVWEIASFSDPVGEIVKGFPHENGMKISEVRVPLGVLAMIYESRPNVTVDAAALALKSGNAIILRGGSDASHSNGILEKIFVDAITKEGVPEGAVQLIKNPDRALVNELVRLNDYVDVAIPRGGVGLKKAIIANATVPVIETGAGVCHLYIDSRAAIEKALNIAINAKTQRPGVCNAIETLLIHEESLGRILPFLAEGLVANGVEIRADEEALQFIPGAKAAVEEDWSTEYLSLVVSIKTVSGIAEAIRHIDKYGTKHSEAIVTESYEMAEKFLNEVDAAAVYVNASTRFTDGGEFGFGGEIGISTQKLHARGPMGVRALTTTKYIIRGNGQIR
ncbi:glutamate-5-semialdehyde dehydrogenase [Ilyobacter polytropus]|uniref:Gamma-glutamyl phosphate reductase n=1 Tax=Ilyobacter polytropus (strain ATCC 51220 / DSM 2926 / LMG 16218 / CuHBu1) TaxID=572544 RepID=E3H7K6_ILYPC|nr:glutamate-5-semialdehyde dehydrogenase [Ilyobacter polytropus]ADO81960.1 glutamate-5-semialdehyde dehydrogenase [Ilyobacter polytropus DSM 2926]